MPPKRTLSRLAAATAATLGGSFSAQAVHLNPNGVGQALIYPYYTVRESAGANAFNTYLTVVNTTSDAKAVRVRLREGRAARPVLDFNLYLSPNDVWAGAVVPTAAGAQLLTADTSCTDPAFIPTGASTGPLSGNQPILGLALHSNAYTGTNSDGSGDTLDRTREGYVEVIEMATLSGSSAAAVSHTAAGVPANCPAIRATVGPIVGAPSGGLWGTLTLINVNNGQDFTLDATPLDGLTTRAFFRPPGDPYPDFNAQEIDPVSTVLAHGNAYRSLWSRPVDAVSAVLMRASWATEYVLDAGTASLTDVVVALPTRHHYVNATTASPPFAATLDWKADCGSGTQVGEVLPTVFFNREEQGAVDQGSNFPVPPTPNEPQRRLCAAAAVASVRNGSSQIPSDTTRTALLGSTTRGMSGGGAIGINAGFQNGWLVMVPLRPGIQPLPPLVSQPASTRTDLATGQVTPGSHSYVGLPVVGFGARSFANGTLQCAAGSCQGNYGGAFPLRYFTAVAEP